MSHSGSCRFLLSQLMVILFMYMAQGGFRRKVVLTFRIGRKGKYTLIGYNCFMTELIICRWFVFQDGVRLDYFTDETLSCKKGSYPVTKSCMIAFSLPVAGFPHPFILEDTETGNYCLTGS